MGGGDDPLPSEDPGNLNTSAKSGPGLHFDHSVTAPEPSVVASEARASTVVPEATAVPSTASVRSSVATADVTCWWNQWGHMPASLMVCLAKDIAE